MVAIHTDGALSDVMISLDGENFDRWMRIFKSLKKRDGSREGLYVRFLGIEEIACDEQGIDAFVDGRLKDLVKDVEENLVNLVRMAGQVDKITGSVHVAEEKQTSMDGEGPQMNAETRDDVVSGQDDVDDLLSSLGF